MEAFGLGQKYLGWVNSLDALEIRLILAVVFLLAAFIIYRRLGASIFWVFLFIGFIAYLVYNAHIGQVYQQRNAEHDQRMELIQQEIDRDINQD